MKNTFIIFRTLQRPTKNVYFLNTSVILGLVIILKQPLERYKQTVSWIELCIYSGRVRYILSESNWTIVMLLKNNAYYEIWNSSHCLGLGHETMTCVVCLIMFLSQMYYEYDYCSSIMGPVMWCWYIVNAPPPLVMSISFHFNVYPDNPFQTFLLANSFFYHASMRPYCMHFLKHR